MMTTIVVVNYLPFVFSNINGNFYMYYSCAIQKNVVPLQSQIRAIGFADIFDKSVCFI